MNGDALDVFEQQMAQGKLYAKLHLRQCKLQFALDGIEAMQELAPNSYASISFGKQSLCLAHMLYRIKPDLPMFFLASWESFVIHNYEEIIESFTSRWPINLQIVMADNVSENPELGWQETRDLGQNDLQNMVNRADWDGWYWGLSKDESNQRRLTLSRRDGQPSGLHRLIYRYKDGRYRCCPLAEWTTLDLAAYISEHDIPLLNIYRCLGLEARTTARLTRKAAEWGGLTALQHSNISAFNQLCQRFPELRGVDKHQ